MTTFVANRPAGSNRSRIATQTRPLGRAPQLSDPVRTRLAEKLIRPPRPKAAAPRRRPPPRRRRPRTDDPAVTPTVNTENAASRPVTAFGTRGGRAIAPPSSRISTIDQRRDDVGARLGEQGVDGRRGQLGQRGAAVPRGHRLGRIHVHRVDGAGREVGDEVRQIGVATARIGASRAGPSVPRWVNRTVDDEPAAQRLGQLRGGRQAQQRDRRRRVLGKRGRPLPPGVQHRGGVVAREEDRAAVERRDRDEVERHLGDDPEAALAAAHRPEQVDVVGVGALGEHLADGAVGGDDREPGDVVGGEAVAARTAGRGHRLWCSRRRRPATTSR